MAKKQQQKKPPQQLLWELDAQDQPVVPVAPEEVVEQMHAAAEEAAAEASVSAEEPGSDLDAIEEFEEVEALQSGTELEDVEVYDGPVPEWLGGDCAKADDQPALFHNEPSWTEHWKGMPEFEQRDLRPFQSVTVHFRSEADREAFAQLVTQTITGKTKSIWYPPAVIGRMADKRFVDGQS